MSTWLMDLRLAFRTLRRAPGFALTVIVVMALGIGVNTMMFSVLRTILDADLPFASPDRIVAIEESSQRTRNDAIDLSAPDFLDVKAAARSLSSMAGSSGFTAMVNFGGDAERFRGTTGTAELLDVL